MRKTDHLKPYQFKKGESGNLKGRPVGDSMKEFARKFLLSMNDEEKIEFMNSLDSDIVWKMAEGNPDTKTDLGIDKEGLAELTEFFKVLANRKDD